MELTRVVAGLRLPFLTGSLLPVWATWALLARAQPVRLVHGLAVTLGVAFLHLAGNLLNDSIDTDRSDRVNRWHTPFSGGSRVILDGVLSRRAVWLLTASLYTAAGLIGVYLALEGRPLVLVFGLGGALVGVLYSILLMDRGWGELAVFTAFGPGLTLGAGYALSGRVDLSLALLGLLPGYLIAAVLWINEFPDFEADSAVGKRNLVVRLGRRRARWVYLALMLLPFPTVLTLVWNGAVPLLAVAVALALPLLLAGVRKFWRAWDDPQAVVPAQALTIQSHLAFSALLTSALILG